MNGHPHILQERIESAAIQRHLADRQVIGECFPDGNERGLESGQQKHERLQESVDRHHFIFNAPRAGIGAQNKTKDGPKNRPEEKAPFLSGPKCSDQQIGGKVTRTVCEHIIDVEAMLHDIEEEQHSGRTDRDGGGQQAPASLANHARLTDRCAIVQNRPRQRRQKRDP